MTDWRAILSRIQQQYSLAEIAGVLECDRQRLDNIKRGIEPKFDFGMRLLAVHDVLTDIHGTTQAAEAAEADVLGKLYHAKRRAKCGGSKLTSTTQSLASGHSQSASSSAPRDICSMKTDSLSAPSIQAMKP